MIRECFEWFIPCMRKMVVTDSDPLIKPIECEKKSQIDSRLAKDLYDACWDGDVMGCIDLLDKGASPDAHFGMKNSTALHAAVKIGSLSIVEVLLRHKPDLTLRDTDGFTALEIAEKSNQPRIAQSIQQVCR